MDEYKVLELVADAKDLHDNGKFGPLQQAEFFKAMEEAMVAEPPPEGDTPPPEEPPADTPPGG